MKSLLSNKCSACAAALMLLILGIALPSLADETADPENARTVIKATKYIDVDEVEHVLDLLHISYAVQPDQNLIVLRGPGKLMDTALKVIDALDEQRPSIDLHVFVLAASKDKSSDIPKDLQAAVEHLQGIFGYTGFELLDNVLLKVREGRTARVDGGIYLGEDATERTAYHFGFEKITLVPEDDRRNIRLKGLKFEVDGKTSGTVSASLMTDVEVREGQKAVIGSSTPQGIGQTLILIIHAVASPDPSWKTASQ